MAVRSFSFFAKIRLFLSPMGKPKLALRKSFTSSEINNTPHCFDPVLARPVSLELNLRLMEHFLCLGFPCQKHLIALGKRTRRSAIGHQKRKKFSTLSKGPIKKSPIFKKS